MLHKLDERQILLDYSELERHEAVQEGKNQNAKEVAIEMLKNGQFSAEQISK